MQVPAYVEYEKATSVEHALALLARFGPEARVLAGGHSLIPMMKLRLAQPETLIDINGLSDLSYIQVTDGELRIGALTRHAQLLDSAVAGEHFAILHDAERVIADPIVRNWGTDRRLALPGRPVRGPVGRVRRAPGDHGDPRPGRHPDGAGAASSTPGPYETVVGPGEMLTELRVPIRPGGGSAYEKVGRRVGDWPVGAAGAALWLDGGSRSPRSGSAWPRSVRRHFAAAEAEDFLRGAPATEETFAGPGEIAAEHCQPAATSAAQPTTSGTWPAS